MNQQMKPPRPKQQPELFWPRLVMSKWLNKNDKESDFSADTDDEGDSDVDSDIEDYGQFGRESLFINKRGDGVQCESSESETFPRCRRRNSETFRAQYINTKELRINVGTWNVGGRIPPDNLDLEDWIDTSKPADIYVLGFQEIVPLNAGNIFGPRDRRPVPIWEDIIRETLNKIRPPKAKVKCYSNPSSPSRFKPSDEIADLEDEISLESESDGDQKVHPVDEDPYNDNEFNNKTISGEKFTNDPEDLGDHGFNLATCKDRELQRQVSPPKRLSRLNCLRTENSSGNAEEVVIQRQGKLVKTFSGTERIGLSWPEPPLDMLGEHVFERAKTFKAMKSFQATKSFRGYKSFKSFTVDDRESDIQLLADLDLDLIKNRKRHPFVRIVSKQMVGIFITVWVQRRLRRHIQNVKVSTVGVGAMGYIGNKGSISVSMSIYQTLFCFVCSHLTSGEKDGDEVKRNSDVHEIHRRTHFRSISQIGLPKKILDHEKVIWLGDLNYRINLPYDRSRELILKREWLKLYERDQLGKELKKGRAFDGWSEGALNFPPTYKYEFNSHKYYGANPKVGRRNPAWCDRILSYGRGLKLLTYRRAELKLSDHRPVTATYLAEVEVFSPRKLQKALTFTDAEIQEDGVLTSIVMDVGMNN